MFLTNGSPSDDLILHLLVIYEEVRLGGTITFSKMVVLQATMKY
jgi:hypothetical protein